MISPLNYDEEVNEDGQVTTVVSIDKEELLDAAEEYFGALKIAKYIPDGYTFEQLTIWSYSEPVVEYIYTDGKNPLVIAFYYSDGNVDEDIVIIGEQYRSIVSGKNLYVNENTAANEYTVMEIAKNYVPIAVLLFFGASARAIMNALINGSGHYRINFATAILDGIILRIGLALMFGLLFKMEYYGFWLGDALAGFTPFFIGVVFYINGSWKNPEGGVLAEK